MIPVGESIVSDLSYSRESLADQPLATYGMDADLIKVEDALHKLKFRGQELIEKWQTKKTKLEQCLTFQEYEVTYQKVCNVLNSYVQF